MADSFTHLINAVLLLALASDALAFVMVLLLKDKQRLEKLVDLHLDIFTHCAAAIVGALRIFRRGDPPPPNLPPPDTKQITKHSS